VERASDAELRVTLPQGADAPLDVLLWSAGRWIPVLDAGSEPLVEASAPMDGRLYAPGVCGTVRGGASAWIVLLAAMLTRARRNRPS
jgi:hypothetical protein